jgi:hypothetical protein
VEHQENQELGDNDQEEGTMASDSVHSSVPSVIGGKKPKNKKKKRFLNAFKGKV